MVLNRQKFNKRLTRRHGARGTARVPLASWAILARFAIPSTEHQRTRKCRSFATTRRAQHQVSARIRPAHPHKPSLHPCLGSFQPEFGPRARSRAQWVASARGAHYMPSYPRHRASNFRCHTSTNPTRVHGGCDALPFVSRLSSSNHVRLFPLSQKRASKGKRQRQVTACRSLSRR